MKNTEAALDLYRKYFSDRQFERLDLFQMIADNFPVQRVLYAGSFVHITPSFVFSDVVYVDNDKQARKFFSDQELDNFIAKRKIYTQAARVKFHFTDYQDAFDKSPDSFDLLISQYAGFVGKYCKPYLKIGGLLLANNSHGDAGLAALDADYQLIAAFSVRNGKHHINQRDLEEYFIPKSSKQITKEDLEKLQKGIGYKKTGSAYLFRKIQ